jgi:hypothetical protein
MTGFLRSPGGKTTPLSPSGLDWNRCWARASSLGGVLSDPRMCAPPGRRFAENPRRPGLWLELTPPLRVNSAGHPVSGGGLFDLHSDSR